MQDTRVLNHSGRLLFRLLVTAKVRETLLAVAVLYECGGGGSRPGTAASSKILLGC